MKVKFNHPPTGTRDPLNDFDPTKQCHYPKTNGVYIYGIRLKINKELKFVPLVVGEGNLYKRLYKDHYLGKFNSPFLSINNIPSKIGDNKELWNFPDKNYNILDICKVYKDMEIYDSTKSSLRYQLAKKLHELIYFQDFIFYQNLISQNFSSKNNLNIIDAYNHLQTGANLFNNYALKIKHTLDNFNSNFYYIYADLYNKNHIELDDVEVEKYNNWDNPKCYTKNSNGKIITTLIEKSVKNALKKINISTTAATANKGVLNMDIIFSNVQNELVNVGGHNYGFPIYNENLII
jgi:hypothetical protein